jgi:hypothetical protein
MKRCKRHRWSEWASTLITWANYQMERIEARLCKGCGKLESKLDK